MDIIDNKPKFSSNKESNNNVQQHDRAFKAALSDIRVARDFLSHYLPMEVKERVNLNTLQLRNESYIDSELKLLQTDVLFTVQLCDEHKSDNKKNLIYLLTEHQSHPDKLMAWRVIKYVCRIIEQHLKETQGKELPVVITLVAYNGQIKYPYFTDIYDLFGDHKDIAKIHLFGDFKLVDFSQIPDEEMRAHQWSGLLEMLMKHIYKRDALLTLESVKGILHELVKKDADDYILSMLSYVLHKANISNRKQFDNFVHENLSEPLETKAMTLAQQLIDEGYQQGIHKGIQKGLLDGERRLLINLLNRRFGTISKTYLEVINEIIDPDVLLACGEKILDAKTIEDIFSS